jgi:hypothetical protein
MGFEIPRKGRKGRKGRKERAKIFSKASLLSPFQHLNILQ